METSIQLEYISKGKIGCTFAALAAQNPKKYDWGFYSIHEYAIQKPKESTISVIFPVEWKINDVKKWAKDNGMYEQTIKSGSLWRRIKRFFKREKLIGLRKTSEDGFPTYVMYTGQDSHVPTRLTPYPMLTWRNRKAKDWFHRVGWSGVLHIAMMPVKVCAFKAESLWRSSFKNSRRINRAPLNEEQAAKTTWKIKS